MADTLATGIKASLEWLLKESLDLSIVTDASRLEYNRSLVDGAGSGQADKLWHDERTLAAGAHDDLDLTALATTLFGNALTVALAKVKGLLIVNTSITAGDDLSIGGASSHEWLAPFAGAGDKIKCPADSCLLLCNRLAGWSVAGGSSDILRIANLGSSAVTYRIVIVGASA